MWLFAACCVTFVLQVQCDTALDLKSLQREFQEWKLKDSPEFASTIGDNRYNDIHQNLDMISFSKRKQHVEQFIYKLLKINRSDLTRSMQYSYDVFLDTMQTFVDGYSWRFYGNLNPLSALEGFQTDPGLGVKILPFYTKGDLENYIARMLATPKQIDQMISLFSEALTLGRTLHNVSVLTVPDQLAKLIVTDPKTSIYYTPFKNKVTNLDIPQSEKDDIIKRGTGAISSVIKSVKRLKSFLEEKYISHTRTTYGVDGWQNGKDYYKACLKWHLTTDMSPEEVHQKGLDEVKRIKEEMKQIMKKEEGFTGSISQFAKILMARPSSHKKTGAELLTEYNHIIHDVVYPKLSTMFQNIPDLKVTVESEKYDGPAGQYFIGTEDGSRPGIFQVNLLKPNETLTFNMMALTLHETVPGHHLQGSYQLKSKLPAFQRNINFDGYYSIPFQFPFYTSYVEGWGLYAESLGEDMGLYRNYLEMFGRYSFEIFRACRLVVDTGLHYFKWSRAQAIQYMVDHTPQARSSIELEIDRYITWPGQACAYKIGELKIRELREKAKAALGSRFKIKDFHSLVLSHGPVPLNTLETIVNDWIKDTRLTNPNIIGK